MEGSEFDEIEFFRAVEKSGTRALLIGRRAVELAPETNVQLPALDDLILTKRFAARPKDPEDVRLLEVLRSEESEI
jgi:hypothetical protein